MRSALVRVGAHHRPRTACRAATRNVSSLLHRKELYQQAVRVLMRKPSESGARMRELVKEGLEHALIDDIIQAVQQQQYVFQITPPPTTAPQMVQRSLSDLLVFEVMAMLLCIVYNIPYQPRRPKSADVAARHSAMQVMQDNFQGATWALKDTIQTPFLPTNYMVLMRVVHQRTQDRRLLTLLWAALNAGCMHDLAAVRVMARDCLLRSRHSEAESEHTLKAVLSEIYLAQLDEYMYSLLEAFSTAQQQQQQQQQQ